MDLGEPGIRVIRLRYPGKCACGAVVAAGVRAAYDDKTRRVVCVSCLGAATGTEPVAIPAEPPAPGIPGSGAQREYERRVAKRDAETAAMRRGLRKFIRSHTPPPQSTQAWAQGAVGEHKVGEVLTGLAAEWVYALHDRRMPRSRANIDHIGIAASGVYVIDAKRYERAKVTVRREGGWGRPVQETLMVRGRQSNHLVAGLAKQLVAVGEALSASPQLSSLPVRGVLCFVGADFPLLPLSLSVADIPIVGPAGLRRRLRAEGDVDIETRYSAYCLLADRLPSS